MVPPLPPCPSLVLRKCPLVPPVLFHELGDLACLSRRVAGFAMGAWSRRRGMHPWFAFHPSRAMFETLPAPCPPFPPWRSRCPGGQSVVGRSDGGWSLKSIHLGSIPHRPSGSVPPGIPLDFAPFLLKSFPFDRPPPLGVAIPSPPCLP